MATLFLSKLAEITASTLQGDGTLKIHNITSLETASVGDISFATGRKHLVALKKSKASAFILTPELASLSEHPTVLINPSPYLAYAKVIAAFYPDKKPRELRHPSCVIDSSSQIASTVTIGANVVIGAEVSIAKGVVIDAGCVIQAGCHIGKNTRLYANVTLYSDTQIGQQCCLHSGVVVGSDGFGYAPDQGEWFKIKQVGNVIIGDQVEIGANTCIDRAALGSTVIANGVKLDNLIQIAHNVTIGEDTAIAGCSAIAGSAKIGQRCQIGGAACIGGHLSIADDVIITGMSMVPSSITASGVYSSGMPISENRQWRKNTIRFTQLDKMTKKLRALEKQVKQLESKQ
ncbi:MAG: UDP-3-O-(3-hydroxymyristoyl)glucosamine N-acyltransferase [Cocleimonas sp.]|nr:UDP-3-O-(3-hydroxymyristoyl)glucosamine N-acyltransferase [Cocleimonas sp.]